MGIHIYNINNLQILLTFCRFDFVLPSGAKSCFFFKNYLFVFCVSEYFVLSFDIVCIYIWPDFYRLTAIIFALCAASVSNWTLCIQEYIYYYFLCISF